MLSRKDILLSSSLCMELGKKSLLQLSQEKEEEEEVTAEKEMCLFHEGNLQYKHPASLLLAAMSQPSDPKDNETKCFLGCPKEDASSSEDFSSVPQCESQLSSYSHGQAPHTLQSHTVTNSSFCSCCSASPVCSDTCLNNSFSIASSADNTSDAYVPGALLNHSGRENYLAREDSDILLFNGACALASLAQNFQSLENDEEVNVEESTQDISDSPNLKENSTPTSPSKRLPIRRRMSRIVRKQLEKSFQDDPNPPREKINALASATETPLKNIITWFKNRNKRAVMRKDCAPKTAEHQRSSHG
eukprot:Nk52_evm23s153 gene=Nk52_evmTU23s153